MKISDNYKLPSQFLTSEKLEEDINLKLNERYFGKTVEWFIKEYGFSFSSPAYDNFFSHTETIEFLKERKVINISTSRLLSLMGKNGGIVYCIDTIIFRQEDLVKRPIHTFHDFFLSDETGLTLNAGIRYGNNYLWMISEFIFCHVFMDILEIPNIKEFILLLENVPEGRETEIINLTAIASHQFMLDTLRSSPCWVTTGLKSIDPVYRGKGYIDIIDPEKNDLCSFVVRFDDGSKFCIMSSDFEISICWNKEDSETARREVVLERVVEEQQKLEIAKTRLINLKASIEKMEEDMVYLPTELEIKLGLNSIFSPNKDDKN